MNRFVARSVEPALGLILDAVVVYAAVEIAMRLRFGAEVPPVDLGELRAVMPLIALSRLGGFYAAGIYRRSFIHPRGFDYADLVQAWAAGTVILAASVFFGRMLETSRLVLVYEALLFLTLAIFWRFTFGMLVRGNSPRKSALVVGDASLGQRLNHFLESEGWEYRVTRTVLPGDDWTAHEDAVFTNSTGVDASVFVRAQAGMSGPMAGMSSPMAGMSGSIGKRLFLIADVPEILRSGAMPYDLGGYVVLDVGGVRREHHYLAAKRALDIALSALSLFFLWPVIFVVAAAVKLTSPGPALFRQERAGHRGRSFYIFKFRTMVHAIHPGSGPQLTTINDRRITGLGKFLRRWSIDELPQLVNVLFGSMSLVGPRPELPEIVSAYPAWRRHVLEAVPGLTGLVQISGRDELTDDEKSRLDLYYAMNRSLEMDVSIMLRTFRAVLKYKGRT